MDDRPAPGGGVALVPEATVAENTEDIPASSCGDASKRSLSPDATMVTEDAKADASSTNGQTENTDRRFVWAQGIESSYNLGSDPQLSTLPAHPLPPTLLQRSEQAAPHEKYFTPIVALSKYPYKFCNKDCMQGIASAFFDQGKFWAREWDLYYLWDIEESKPLILVRESQVHDLLKEINSHLKLGLKITDSQREEGLVLRFPDHPRCRPRYLGRSHNRSEYNSMTDQVPLVGVHAAGESATPPLDAQTLEDFKHMIEEAWEVTKNKSKASKEKSRVNRLKKQKVFTDQLKRAQRYLGLRPAATDGPSAPPTIPAVDVSRSAPFAYDRSVVFICVDVEAYEKGHRKITEVGMATLDTRDLIHVAPGKDGKAWRDLIQTRHFRVTEFAHLVNSEYVAGCPGSFFFGESEFVSLKDLPTSVAACFEPPFCAKPGETPHADNIERGDRRNLIFLGHDTLTDVKYLQDIGFDPLVLPNLLEAQDSASLFRVWQREDQTTKLARILEKFDIDYFGLHNAGNDAMYTVQVFLAICVREASIRNSPEVQQIWDARKESKIAFEQQELRQDVEKDAKVWDDLEANGDGGGPVPIVIKKPAWPKVTPQTGTNGTPASVNVGDRDRGDGSNGASTQSDRGGSDGGHSKVDNSDGWGGSAAW
ncbi:uncharacterized protein N0V89_010073 [Didymosphaeria variabile]|uniref:Gfd2/YDR514C-like C-terminal domain-containing protein n=1 Tax=Didymosphaeria variabile TaxID=1932322 RepID=A0A9W8XF53_9PLEO|nr:uncharacterized protein N0V89_010073 [Didymosphaeria variabile]KAJ4348695.1 hypothetical protein N0V89_010073 [Didymosphaeria variabile]